MRGTNSLGALRNATLESISETTKITVENVVKKGEDILSTGATIAVDTPRAEYDGNDSSCQKTLE